MTFFSHENDEISFEINYWKITDDWASIKYPFLFRYADGFTPKYEVFFTACIPARLNDKDRLEDMNHILESVDGIHLDTISIESSYRKTQEGKHDATWPKTQPQYLNLLFRLYFCWAPNIFFWFQSQNWRWNWSYSA